MSVSLKFFALFGTYEKCLSWYVGLGILYAFSLHTYITLLANGNMHTKSGFLLSGSCPIFQFCEIFVLLHLASAFFKPFVTCSHYSFLILVLQFHSLFTDVIPHVDI